MKKKLLESTPYEGLANGTHIDVEVSYTKGGVNYLSGGSTPRGYYLNVTPVTRKGDGMVSYTLFSGLRILLLQANRYSDKQHTQAVALGKQQAPALIQRVLEQERTKFAERSAS